MENEYKQEQREQGMVLQAGPFTQELL